MTMSDAIERLVVSRASADEIGRQAVAEGMLTLRHDGFEKVRLGYTSIEEVLRVVV
jgi:type IV pilus assembly protein PilB